MARIYQDLLIQEYDAVEKEVLSAARARAPFSLIRLGHCEPRLLGYPDRYSKAEIDRSFKRQFGRTNIPDSEAAAIRDYIRHAVREANTVGLGVKDVAESALDELWVSTPGILKKDGLIREQQFCHVNVHYHMMRSRFIERLVPLWDSVCLITCRDVAMQFQRDFSARSVEWIRIPEHAATAANGRPVGNHWPDAFRQVNLAIEALGPRLYIVGAGLLGKPYCARIKQVGGLALDIGSVFDVWANIGSRSGHTEALLQDYRLGSRAFS